MTGPATGEPDRGATTPARTSTTRGPASAIVILLALGLALRVIIAYLLPGSGFGVDLNAFRFWANDLALHGPLGFYERGFFADYTPGYLYLLWLLGLAGQAIGGIGDLIKVPAIVADLVVGYLVYAMVIDLGGSGRRALLGAAVFLFIPISWFDSTVWGQVDSVGVVFLLLGLRALWRDRPEQAALWATVAAVTKPQLGILVPIVAAVLLRRYLLDRWGPWRRQASDPDGGTVDRPMFGDSGPSRRGPIRLVTSALVGLATATALSAPFGLSFIGLLAQVVRAGGGYPYLTVNAYNPWGLLTLEGSGLAANGTWLNDIAVTPGGTAYLFGPVPAIAIGTALLLLAIVTISVVVARRPDRTAILVGLAVMAIAFFVVPTRVHERYLYPFIALGPILVAISARWRIPYGAIAVASFLNMYVVLTTLYPGNPAIQDWLGIGPAIRSPLGVTVIALTHLVVFVWAFLQLRGRALDRVRAEVGSAADDREPAAASPLLPGLVPPIVPAAPPAVAAIPVMASAAASVAPAGARASARANLRATLWRRPARDAPGMLAAIRRRLLVRPVRPDRSRSLAAEGGGRFDRLDVWIVVVLAIGVLTLRMYRLELPYQMHFDEVYHARTATEFLQDWRYGEPHSIYEYTHPHLAKYAMAAGLVAFGDDQVTAESDLAVPVHDALVEARWDDPRLPAGRAGDRLYAATGAEVRAYDLTNRDLVATIPVPGAVSLALDHASHRLFVGTDAGGILVVDTDIAFDDLRTGGPEPGPGSFLPFADLAVPVSHMFATDDGRYLLAATSEDELVSLDGIGGLELGRTHLESIADLAGAGTGDSLVGRPADVQDPATAAAFLADQLGESPATYAALLASGGDQVVIAPAPAKEAREAIDAAIADGTLAGFEFVSLPRVAVATADGIAFVTPATAAVAESLPIEGGVRGLVLTSGLDKSRIYAASGSSLAVVGLPAGDDPTGGVDLETTIEMPGPVRDVAYDPASLMVHALGTTPDGSATTIYVIEPHGNAVYADARLPFEPAAWVTDAAPLYPGTDRQEILAFAPSGKTAAVEIGNHAFAWRLPGVVAGTLMAVLVYLLARLLVRRRSVAVIAALVTLLDGMLFVQSRIAMNDAYVGLFIVAAYTLFAGLWLGRWRRPWAFWLLMPAIGGLLGLALASKWVALYAIGGLGVLILARSALGRLLLIGGLVAATAVLGYLSLAVPEGGTSGGNLTFMLLMVGLTLLAVAVSVLHPIAWSLEEVRLAIAGPVVAGVGLLLAALPLGLVGPLECAAATGACANPPVLEVAFALVALGGLAAVAFRVAARWGFGPLAPPRSAYDPASLVDAAAPPPNGWLRPGWAWGLPVLWVGICLVVIPVGVYVASYLPWVELGNRLTESWPAGNAGQTLADLTRSMYDYHNNLRATHAASSPWWAWPLDLKPVWFYQGGFAASTAGAIYDAGNLVFWWLSIPAMAFCAWQAYRRQSLALALVTIAFACQWLPWVRIDRATFQYHYYTSLPFLALALGYFLAELWHGASIRTWLLARAAAALAVLGPALMWLFRGPLCSIVGVESVNPGSQACVPTPPGEIVITARTAGLVLVMGVAIAALVWQLLHLDDPDARGGPPDPLRRLRGLAVTAGAAAVGIVFAGALLGETVLVQVSGFSPEVIALGLLIPLGLVAWVVLTARDARRFVVGAVYAGVMWFVIWYPNLSGLALPAAFVNAYQGFLPTYLYPFQFPVNTDAAGSLPALGPDLLALTAALAVTCVVVGYSAWTWKVALAERRVDARAADDLARSSRGA